MLVDAVPVEEHRSAAFGFLQALDVGGGALAGVYVLVAVAAHVPFRWIFVATVVPLVASTVSLSRAHVSERRAPAAREVAPGDADRDGERDVDRDADRDAEGPPSPGARSLLSAAALYGFTYYSVGFPVLTVA
jgi:hypothetical protein